MIRVACVPLDLPGPLPGPYTAAAGPGFDLRVFPAGRPPAGIEAFRPQVLWLDATSSPDAPPWIRSFIERSGPGLLLTGGAAVIPASFGLEPYPPTATDLPWLDRDDELFLHTDFADAPRLRGHAAFRRHQLFDGLGSGVFTWRPHDGEPCHTWTYRRPAWPGTGRVIAVERAYIHINAGRATIWEYPPADGRPHVLCIGAYLPLESHDPACRPHIEALTRNALRYLAAEIPAGAPDLYWETPDTRTLEDPTLEMPPPSLRSTGAGLPLEIAPLRLPGKEPADPFTLAGRRALATGTEGTGAGEIWVHPLRVAMDLGVANSSCASVTVTPLGLLRRLRIAGAALEERTHVAAELPAVVLEYERPPDAGTDPGLVTVHVEWSTDLRLMWPYPADATGPLRWRVDGPAFVVRSGTGESVCFHATVSPETTSPPPAFAVTDASGGPGAGRAGLRCSLSAGLRPGDRLRLVIAAAVAEGDVVASTLAAMRDPAALVRARAASLARLRRERLQVEAPDARVGQAVEWAKARLDGYLVETPDLGRSLVAGYWKGRPGWNDGRPGYAWYFGRDAVWTALASLACGDFGAARDVIAFLGRHQDLTGKILHECTTSGTVHYDAADATPLYLLLVARFLAWSGDLGFVRAQWPHVRRAVDFCLSTDTDGDGLIENTGAGHGWIEFGRLGGGRVTAYNAAIWTAALRELAVTAESIGEARLPAELESRAKTARLAFERVFFDPLDRRYALKASDGPDGWVRDFTPTASHAVPLLLGVADAGRAASWLDLVASDSFTTDWGVRLIPDSEPDFDPARYHGGAVWPLFTGWVSWAEYAAGRGAAAFRHWRSNLDLPFERAKGAWDEVLHGTRRIAAGVCPDQAWSTAMAIAPLVYGLLGAEPDAPRGRLRLRPWIPDPWDRFHVRNLRMGESSIRLRFERNGSVHSFRIEQEEGAVPVRLVFEPVLPGRLASARIDGSPAHLDPQAFGGRVVAPSQLMLDHERVVEIEVEGQPV